MLAPGGGSRDGKGGTRAGEGRELPPARRTRGPSPNSCRHLPARPLPARHQPPHPPDPGHVMDVHAVAPRRSADSFPLSPPQPTAGKRKRSSRAVLPPRPAAPPRAARASAAPLRAHLAATLASWSAALTALQPKCVVGEAAVARGVALALAAARAAPAGPLAPATAAAAFWVAVKADGTRCAVPSRGLLARATGVAPADLGAAELDVLCTLRFDVYSGEVARTVC